MRPAVGHAEAVDAPTNRIHIFRQEIDHHGLEGVSINHSKYDESTIQREFGLLLDIKYDYPKFVLYQEGSFKGNYEGTPAVRIPDWLTGDTEL